AERMLAFVTVFSGRPSVNILDAAPQVVAALPGMTPENLQRILTERSVRPSDPRTLLESIGSFGGLATREGSRAIRVTVRIEFDDRRRISAEVVIAILDDEDEPFRVLSWHDEFDGIAEPHSQQAGSP